jgi:hypothetical protein
LREIKRQAVQVKNQDCAKEKHRQQQGGNQNDDDGLVSRLIH